MPPKEFIMVMNVKRRIITIISLTGNHHSLKLIPSRDIEEVFVLSPIRRRSLNLPSFSIEIESIFILKVKKNSIPLLRDFDSPKKEVGLIKVNIPIESILRPPRVWELKKY